MRQLQLLFISAFPLSKALPFLLIDDATQNANIIERSFKTSVYYMPDACESSAREKILDAAENAFADLGFEGASLRNIVQNAEVNLATVYYYFGSKEGLMNAVFKRLFDPLKQEQLDRFNRLIAEAQGQPLTVEGILEAMLAPAMCLTKSEPATHNSVATRLIGRIVTDPNPQTQELLSCRHQEVRKIYIDALHQTLPELPLQDLQWRVEFIWGALAFTLCNPSRIDKQTNGVCGSVETNLLPQMVACFAAGLRAPGVKQNRSADASSACFK